MHETRKLADLVLSFVKYLRMRVRWRASTESRAESGRSLFRPDFCRQSAEQTFRAPGRLRGASSRLLKKSSSRNSFLSAQPAAFGFGSIDAGVLHA